jgi:hypothetical protein
MRNLLISAFLLVAQTLAFPQQLKPVRSDVRKLLELLPKGCVNIAEASAKCTGATSEAIAPFKQALEAMQNERISGASGMSASQEAMMKKMQDPAFQEQMKKMSPQQLAELMQQMQGGSLPMSGAVTPEETALAEEFERLNQDLMNYSAAFNKEWTDLQADLEAKKLAERNTLTVELAACPVLVGGETTYQDPTCLAAAEKKYDGRMEAVLNAWLPKANDVVVRYRADVIKHYEEAQKRLVAVDYGSKCGVQMFYDMVNTTQTMILGSVALVGDMAEEAWSTACREKNDIETVMTR